ncbi:hypothetical protein Btru_029083 [Bulinus truncatus]|nr:hypothetical protein Btru_029083 [Bulinus truncatus]
MDTLKKERASRGSCSDHSVRPDKAKQETMADPDEDPEMGDEASDVHEHVSHMHAEHMFHVHVPHDGHMDHVDFEGDTDQSDLIGELAHIFALTALLIYGFTLIGCYAFRPSFIRQLAYILQMVRLSLTLATLLPCVLHWQAYQIFPIIPARIFPFLIIALLFANILFAMGFRLMTTWLWENYQKSNVNCGCKTQRPPPKTGCCLFNMLFKKKPNKGKKKRRCK